VLAMVSLATPEFCEGGSPSRTSLRSFTTEVTETTKPFEVSEIANRKSEMSYITRCYGSLTTFNILA
jgi:hypothetical protein